MCVELCRRLRSLLEAVAENRSPLQVELDALYGLAARAVGDQHEDAVGDFIVSTLEATRAGRAASSERLLDLPDCELVAVVRHRLVQHAQQRLPRRRLFKAIRTHVAQVLDRPTDLAEVVAPLSLLVRGRLSATLVSAATYHLLATEPATPRSPGTIAAALMATYFSTSQHEQDPDVADVHVGLDAAAAASDLRAALEVELLRVVERRHQGLALQEIAQLEGVATSTVHARLHEAVRRLRRHAAHTGVDIDTGRAALEMLTA